MALKHRETGMTAEEMEKVGSYAPEMVEPMERLTEIAKSRKIEYENSLLRESLAKSTDELRKLVEESGNLQTARINEIQTQQNWFVGETIRIVNWMSNEITNLQDSNQLFSEKIDGAIKGMSDRVEQATRDAAYEHMKDTTDELNRILSEARKTQVELNNTTQRGVQQVNESAKAFSELMKKNWDDINAHKRNLFVWHGGVKSVVFWVSAVGSILTSLAFILFLLGVLPNNLG